MACSAQTIFFCYADPAGFSGQKVATEILISGLSARGWDCRRLPQPVRRRGDRDGPWEVLRYVGSLFWAWGRSLRLLFARGDQLHVNLGQTRAAFVRDVFPLCCGVLGLGRDQITISLHGSLFMRWRTDSINARIFSWLLARAGRVTVLGARQQSRLLELKIPPERVTIVPNTCDLLPLGAEMLQEKLRKTSGRLRFLHLSALIDSKGFPEYLEALRLLAGKAGSKIEAVICGKVALSEFSQRFLTEAAAESWIEAQIEAINRSERVHVSWIHGAVGEAKAELFRQADVFVLPTNYPVEAQPIVLLEAMAAGCAIVTTRVGEIETILNESCAMLLNDVRVEHLAAQIEQLVTDADSRRQLATAAWARFTERYQFERHIEHWEDLFGQRRHE